MFYIDDRFQELFFHKKLVLKKRILGRSKIKKLWHIVQEKLKLYNINLFKKEYIDLLPFVEFRNLYLEKIITCYCRLLGHFS